MSANKKTPWALIALILISLIAIFIAIGSYLKGKHDAEEKYRQKTVEVDARMDSLRNIEYRLRNSLDSLQHERNELTVIRTVFKTVYDTVHIKTVPISIVNGLNTITQLPIPPEK